MQETSFPCALACARKCLSVRDASVEKLAYDLRQVHPYWASVTYLLRDTRAHIPRATSRQLSLRESLCDESLCRVIARFPLPRYLSRMTLLTMWCTRRSGECIWGSPSIQDFGTETRDNGHLQDTHRDSLTELARACLSRGLAQETLTC